MTEHLLNADWSCTCGEQFGTERMAAQHQWWNLQLAGIGKTSEAYKDSLIAAADFQAKALTMIEKLVSFLEAQREALPNHEGHQGATTPAANPDQEAKQ